MIERAEEISSFFCPFSLKYIILKKLFTFIKFRSIIELR